MAATMEEAWRGASVHDADINLAQASYFEEKAQNSNDSRWPLPRRNLWCQRCRHRAAVGSSPRGPYVVRQVAVGRCVEGCGL